MGGSIVVIQYYTGCIRFYMVQVEVCMLQLSGPCVAYMLHALALAEWDVATPCVHMHACMQVGQAVTGYIYWCPTGLAYCIDPKHQNTYTHMCTAVHFTASPSSFLRCC